MGKQRIYRHINYVTGRSKEIVVRLYVLRANYSQFDIAFLDDQIVPAGNAKANIKHIYATSIY